MMKVLVMADWYEPGFKAGGPIRSCVNLVRKLASKAGVSVITRNTDYHETTGYEGIAADTWIRKDNVDLHYISAAKLSFGTLKKLLLERKPDVLYLNSMFSLYFTVLPFLIARLWMNDARIVIAPRGMLAPGALSLKATKKRIFLSLFNLFGSQKVEWHATNKDEAEDIRKIFRNAVIHVAANLVDLNDRPIAHICKEKGKLKLVSVARISPEKNLLYALEVLSEIESTVVFSIYGTIHDKAYWDRCKELIDKMPQHEIIYKGVIKPADIPEVLSSSHFLFMTTLGENFGHIIIESFAAGTPVIISDRTPWRSLSEMNIGYDISLSREDYFKYIIEEMLMLDGLSYDVMSKSAFTFAQRYMEEKNELNSYKFLYS